MLLSAYGPDISLLVDFYWSFVVFTNLFAPLPGEYYLNKYIPVV